MKLTRLLLVAGAVLAFPVAASAQVRLEAQAYARSRAQCGYLYQEQVRLRCPGNAQACTARFFNQQRLCLQRAEQNYVRNLQRLLRQRD